MLPGLDNPIVDDAFSPLGVLFDGTNDYLSRGADFTGNADAKTGMMSFWFRRNGGTGSTQRIWTGGSSDHVIVSFDSSNRVAFLMESSGGVSRLDMRSSASYTDTTTWHHVIASWNVGSFDPAKTLVYVDDVNVTDINTLSNDFIDYTNSNHYIGANSAAGSKLNADIAELFFTRSSVTINSATRQKFRTSLGRPVDLGTDGSIPLGSPPLLFLGVRPGEAAAAFNTNRGTGGGMTMTGTLVLSATNP